MTVSKAWILYDGRAEFDGTDDAMVLEFAGTTRAEVRTSLRFWHDHDGVLVEYDSKEGHELANERIIGHLREGAESLMSRCVFGDA